ncbi:MAG TPA: YciI family protein [Pyrinomonadaceae bacterium]|jgi:YCII-related domain.|nr:YciI family protein [Pyrinomonadaceae bacterium]
MKRQLSILIVTFILVATASLAFAALGQRTQQSQKQFALLLKATGPEFFKMTQEPDGKQMVEKHFKKLQALTQQGVCLFSGHTLVTDESGFGIIVVRVGSEAEAQKIIDDDDLVKAGLVRGTIFPFEVVTAAK